MNQNGFMYKTIRQKRNNKKREKRGVGGGLQNKKRLQIRTIDFPCRHKYNLIDQLCKIKAGIDFHSD